MTPELCRLATRAGIAVEWHNHLGRPQAVSAATLGRVLAALGHACETPTQIAHSLAALNGAGAAPPMVTGRVGDPLQMPLPAGDEHAGLHGELTLESGEQRSLLLAVVTPATPQARPSLSLGPVNQAGYHRLVLTVGSARHERTLAVAPRKAFDPGAGRCWGTAVQLYALRAESGRDLPDTGIGDFGALAAFAQSAGAAGAHALAISPTHAGFAADPAQFSPYAPSSRLAHNSLLIDPAAVAGLERARAAARAAGIEAEALALAAADHIDWPTAGPLKLRWLRALFDNLAPQAALAEPTGHAVFEALHGHFMQQGLADWRQWPAAFQNPVSPEVAAFAHEQAREVRFHAWLQAQADAGLAAAQRAARDAGMAIGLVADLAVGMVGSGSHAWSRRADLLVGLEVGAPPDLLNTRGQGWGLTAFSPRALQESGFEPFLATLRTAMRHAGGVRIDHVLGLNRLWIVPEGASPAEGAYLHYPFDDLLNLIVLESHRHRAIVIGEDLGTVPAGLREKLAQAGIFGMRVLWFERDGEAFRPPAQWDADAVAMTTTHDLATAAGWWCGRDIEWRARCGSEPDAAGAQRQRDQERTALAALFPGRPVGDGVDLAIEAVAQTPGPLAIVPVEDLLGLVEQPNLPGTVHEHPNWRQRLPLPADRLLTEPPARERAARLTSLRGGVE